MSLYEEALIEAKKLKEIAEADAKQAIVEEITPHIRKMIASSLAEKPGSVLYEEEDKMGGSDAPTGTAPVADPAGTVDAGTPPPSTDATMAPPTSSEPPVTAMAVGAPSGSDAPIQVSGADALNMPMPGPDGKLVVDFDDLFTPAEPGDDTGAGDEGSGSAEMAPEVPGGMPSPTPVDVNPTPADATVGADTTGGAGLPGEGEAMVATGQGDEPKASATEPQLETYELFSEALDLTAKRVNKAYSSKGVPSLMKEALQDKLFQLIESLETLVENKLVSENLGQILESRLEILHLKLQEAVLINTYEGTKGTDMASKSLKEFAAKMLSESETIEGGPITSPADVHKSEKSMTVQNANNAAADKAGTHAQKITEPTVTLKTEAAELAKLEEELRALIAEDEGDSLADDEGKQDLAGAASSIPDKKVGQVDVTKTPAGGPSNPASYVQGVSENIEHSKETGSEEVVGKTSTGHPKKESVAVSGKALNERTKKLKAEGIRKQIAALQEQLKECGMEMETEAAGNGLPAPGVPPKKSVMGEDDTVINFNFDLSDLVGGLDGLGDDDEIEIVDDEDEPSGGSEFGGGIDAASEPSGDEAGSDLDLGGDEEGSEPSDLGVGSSEGDSEGEEEEDRTMPLSERIRRARKSTNTTLAENKALKTQLAEQTLFNAKVVHLQPFLNNRNLTKEQKQKIVEYLDRGKTVNEVKTIYTKVKTVLESTQKAKVKAGSSSRPAGAGAATLNESVNTENLYEGAVLVEAERNRLMELAGIRRK
jgi:hypothetical protein